MTNPANTADEDLRFPFLVLTGFLGSGKTTLLNRLLREESGWLVLMNEFGQQPLDQQLMDRNDIPLAVLSGGCVCCTVRGALAPMLKNLYMSRAGGGAGRFDKVIMETSGVADPGPVLDTLLRERWLAARYRLQGIIATIDAQNALAQLDRFPEAARQAALAGYLWITKADLVDAEVLARLLERLKALNPVAEMVVLPPLANGGGPGLEAISRHLPRRFSPRFALADEVTIFESVALVFDQPLRSDGLLVLEDLLRGTGRDLPRIKGILNLHGETGPVVVHGVLGRLYPPTRLAAWPVGDQRSRLVVVGAAADLEAAKRFISEFESQALG